MSAVTLADFARLVRDGAAFAESPSPFSAARAFATIVEVALPFLPHEDLRKLLDDTARARVDTIADAAEAAKFGT